MNCDSRIITEPTDFFRIPAHGNRWLFVLWFVLGCASFGFDSLLQPALHRWGQQPTVEWIAQAWGELGAAYGIAAFLIAGLVATWHSRDSTALEFIASICLAGLAAQAIKHGVGRARPETIAGETQFFGPLAWFRVEHGIRIDSFPSGHTAAAFAMAMSLSLRWPHGRWLWFVLAGGVGLTRILTNAHYTSDVIFGSLLGTLIASGTHTLRHLYSASLEVPLRTSEFPEQTTPETSPTSPNSEQVVILPQARTKFSCD